MANGYETAVPDMTPEQYWGTNANRELGILPQAAATLDQVTPPVEVARMPSDVTGDNERMAELGKQPDVPLESGIGTWDYLLYKQRETGQDQFNFLAKRFGAENVRVNPMGKPVVRLNDPKTGKPVDRTVDPWEMDADTMAAFAAGGGLDIVMSALALRGGNPKAIAGQLGKVPLLGKVFKTGETALEKGLIGSAAFEGSKVGREALARAYDNPPVDPSSIGYNVGEGAKAALAATALTPLDALMGMGMVKLGQGAKWVWDAATGAKVAGPSEVAKRTIQGLGHKFAKETLPSRLGREGVEFWKNKGIDYKGTVGEMTDIPFFAKAEGYTEQHPAAAASILEQRAGNEESIREMQRYMLNKGTLRSDLEIANNGLMALKPVYEAADQTIDRGVEAAKGRVGAIVKGELAAEEASTQKKILNMFNVLTLPERGYGLLEDGTYLNQSASKTRDVFWGNVSKAYQDLYSHPKFSERILPTPADFISKLKDLKSKLPSIQETVENVGYDTYGNPIAVTSTETQPLKEFVPPGVLGKLNDFLKMEGKTIRLDDLKSIRTEINNSIKRSQPFGHTKEHFLEEMGTIVDDALQKGIDTIGDPGLRAAWDNAVGTYKAGISKFRDKLLARLWAHPEEVAVDNAALFKSIEASPARYEAMVNFFGKGSEAHRAFQETAIKKMLSESLADGSGATVEIGDLIRRAKALSDKNGSLFKDMFPGNSYERLADFVKSRQELEQAAGGITKALEGEVSLKDLAKVATGKFPVGREIADMQRLELQRKKLYQNAFVKKFISREIGVESFNPEDFTRALAESNLKDVDQVMSILESRGTPDTVADLRSKVLQTIFRKAQRPQTVEDAAREAVGDPTYMMSKEGLDKVLGTDEQREVYRRILGPRWEELGNLRKVLLLPAQKAERAKGVGILAGGQATGGAIRALMNPLAKGAGELSGFAKYKLAGILMSRDWAAELAKSMNKPLPPPIIGKPLSQPALSALITSSTFLNQMAREFKDPMTRLQVMSTLKLMAGQENQSQENQ